MRVLKATLIRSLINMFVKKYYKGKIVEWAKEVFIYTLIGGKYKYLPKLRRIDSGKDHLLIGIPFYARDLFDYIDTINNGMELILLCRKICEGICFLHRNAIIHCDIKISNIMVDDGGNPIIIDFGHSETTHIKKHSLCVQTDQYRAPEINLSFTEYAEYTTAIDVWSVGVLIFELASGISVSRYYKKEDAEASKECAKRFLDEEFLEDSSFMKRYFRLCKITRSEDKILTPARIQLYKVAAACLDPNPETRPLISTVISTYFGGNVDLEALKNLDDCSPELYPLMQEIYGDDIFHESQEYIFSLIQRYLETLPKKQLDNILISDYGKSL